MRDSDKVTIVYTEQTGRQRPSEGEDRGLAKITGELDHVIGYGG